MAAWKWKYEPDERPKRKHHWDKDVPGFVSIAGEIVAKCPRNLSLERAEELINEGIPFDSDRAGVGPWPGTIYVVHEGAVYRAKPTSPGVSYHGFPETAERCRKLPRTVRNAILARADELGCGVEVRRWMNG